MEQIAQKLAKIGQELRRREAEIVEADASLGFVSRYSSMQLKGTIQMLEDSQESLATIRRRKGVCDRGEEVAFLLPYNYSSYICILAIGQVLVGNNVRMKPSELSASSARIMADILTEVFPQNVSFDYRSGREFMQWAITERKIKVVILYGSHLIALEYLPSFRDTGKKFIFEGPGKNPFIVLKDAMLSSAVEGLKRAKYRASGQICFSPGIVYVQEEVFDEFLDKMLAVTKRLNVGSPLDPATDIGPLGSSLAVARIKEQLEDAEAQGGQVLCGGNIEGNLVYPTIVTNAKKTMIGMTDESFGPVLWVTRFKTVDELIELAADNVFGLAMTICGVDGVQRIVSELKGGDYLHRVPEITFGKYGMVSLNPSIVDDDIPRGSTALFRPFGGYGYSGWVCETTEDYFELKQGPKNMLLETSEPKHECSVM
jgi:acyl-CoA reductase-like NAD-dependent aldehyde dehydrogenase